MKLIATSVYFSDEGKPMQTHQLIAEWDAEHELPGDGDAGIAGRAIEIKAMAKSLLDAIQEETSE
ncbi:MAG TPA: hypothetical protein VHY22_13475 [Chthoniobacteraceae bacterium]|jgi:hypothetical protein|nr:hypothetical protein [Chthoniobacteraceae bacterium]